MCSHSAIVSQAVCLAFNAGRCPIESGIGHQQTLSLSFPRRRPNSKGATVHFIAGAIYSSPYFGSASLAMMPLLPCLQDRVTSFGPAMHCMSVKIVFRYRDIVL